MAEYQRPWHLPASSSDSGAAERRVESAPAAVPEVEETATSAKRRSGASGSRSDFTEPTVATQFKLPRDLVASLKLHSISQGKSMSEIVFECCTSPEWVSKAWVSSRKAS